MKGGRWLDHLPPWMAWGAIASTGAFEPSEVALMALPLLGAALVEGRRFALYRFRRLLEVAALGAFLLQVAARTGLLPTVINTLFVLCGVRLSLPRETPQRRQVLLMGFLLFLTTAISTSDLDFLLWSLLWVAGGGLVLLQLNWETSARHGEPGHAPPYRSIPAWTLATLVLAAGFFTVLPRLRLGLRSLPLAVHNMGGIRAGLSDVLDLSGAGPVQGSSDVVLRIVPPERTPEFEQGFGLLRGVVLEELEGQRWSVSPFTPRRGATGWGRGEAASLDAETFLSPDPLSVVPLPYGQLNLEPPEGEQLRIGPGASLQWWFPVRRILPLRMHLTPRDLEREYPLSDARYRALTHPGQGTEDALRWSLRAAPGPRPPRELAEALAGALRRYRYTLDNPSGGAGNPLEDFLERTRAGHCEFFASALAIMLRRRGVPARVVNGYRLGPWNEAGGYYQVTRNQAHSWVEYFDPEALGWRTVDPTPSASASTLATGSLASAMGRMTDALRFAWDRHVVRFSDEDQVAGLGWIQARLGALDGWRFRPTRGILGLLGALLLLAALRTGWKLRPRTAPAPPGRIPELAPLVRAVSGPEAPRPGETARDWLARLAGVRPERAAALGLLAREADAVAYGGKGSTALTRLAREETLAWKAPPRPPLDSPQKDPR